MVAVVTPDAPQAGGAGGPGSLEPPDELQVEGVAVVLASSPA
jgi:hypothetical protein